MLTDNPCQIAVTDSRGGGVPEKPCILFSPECYSKPMMLSILIKYMNFHLLLENFIHVYHVHPSYSWLPICFSPYEIQVSFYFISCTLNPISSGHMFMCVGVIWSMFYLPGITTLMKTVSLYSSSNWLSVRLQLWVWVLVPLPHIL